MRMTHFFRANLRGAAIASAAVLMSVVVVAAQQRSQATPPPPSIGTAEISGTVMTDEANPRPVRRAVVTLVTASTPIGRSTTTDDAGRFVFSRLAAGNYSAPRATKPGYVTATHGEKRVGGIGAPITLTEGQRLTIAFKMLRGAVITGTLVDQGRPAANLSVQATRVRVVNGVRVTADAYYYEGGGYGSTDDRGIYRIYGLPPGDYIVAMARRSVSSTAPVRPITESEMQWAQQQLQGGSGTAATPSSGGNAPSPAQAVAMAPVYYPGTTVAAQATTITLVAGQERGGVDFGLQTVPTARVAGSIIGLDGQPAATAQVTLVPRVDASAGIDSMMMIESMMMGRTVVTDGKFVVQAVVPGDYTIAVRGASTSASGPGRGGPPPVMNLWASTDISVNGVDQTDFVLRLVPGVDIAGRVTFEGGDTEKPADLSTVQVRLRSAPTPGLTVSVGAASSPVNADGTFTLRGVTPGRYLVSSYVPGGITPIWTMKSARAGDVDAGDLPFEVGAGRDPSEISITYTDKMGELSGRLLDGANKPTSQLSIIVFPVDKAMWSQTSRRIKQPIRPANDGAFKFTGLLAGEYFLAALSDFEQMDVYKPEFLDQVAAVAMKITIGDGEKKVQDLKIAGGLR